MSIKQNLDKWIAELESDGMCDISDNQVIALIRGYSALEAKCAALAAELKQSQIDAGCYKHGMEASNARLAQVAAENAALKSAHPQPFGPEMMKALDAYEKYQDEVPETGMLDAFFILRESIRVKTPVTDAFLAEVRAQGAEECVRQLVISDDDDFSDAPNICAMVAHQLRQEAAQ